MKTKQLITCIYALVAFIGGAWRHLQTGDSPQAVWFGLVVALLALAGAFLLSRKNRLPGYVLIYSSLVLESGWFLHRMFSGHSEGKSIRVILILTMCAAELAVLLWKTKGTANSFPPK